MGDDDAVAVDVEADLIVVGTHGARGVERLLLGSVAQAIVRSAKLPVLVARPKRLAGLPKTPGIDAPRPGAPLHAEREDMHASSELVDVGGHTPSHIAGLI